MLFMECLARRKLADYLVVALASFFSFFFFLHARILSVMLCLGLTERCSCEHRSPRLGGGGDMYCTHSLFSVFMTNICCHSVRMVVVRCVCAFHAVRMGAFCGWIECAYSHLALLRLYVWLSFAYISVFFVGGLSVRTVTMHF